VSGGELFLEWSYPSSLVIVASVAVIVLVVVVVVVPARVVATGAGAAAISATRSETSRIVVVFHTPVRAPIGDGSVTPTSMFFFMVACSQEVAIV